MVSKEKAALARERQKEKRKEREALEKEKRLEREAVAKIKAGRPKSANPKAIKFSIRVDAATEEKLEALCAKYNISKGKAIRAAIEMMLDSDERGR